MKWRKFISLFLIITLLITSFPVVTYATEQDSSDSWPEDMYGTADFNEDELDESDVVPVAEDESLRSESVKHFMNSDGTFTAVNYFIPVHYQEEDSSEWKEIDNTLKEVTREENGEDVISYVPTSSPVDVEISDNLDREKHIALEGSEHKISWYYEDVKAAKGKKKELKEAAKREKKEEKYKLKKPVTDGLVFENITNGTNLEVLVDGANLKENLILKNKRAQTEYVICYDIGELVAEQKDTHTIVFKDGDEDAYIISAPYMKDAAGIVSEDVCLELISQSKTSARVRLTVDKNWVKDKKRIYPITVDPYVMETTKNFNYDATAIYESDVTYPYGTLLVGNDNEAEYGRTKSYVKFSLPTLKAGDMVTGGNLYLAQSAGAYGFSAVGDDELQINAYRLTSSWTADDIIESSGYSGLPDRDTTVVDYETVSRVDEPTWRNFDISKVVKGWYEDDNNYGICLIADDQSQWALARFFATDCTDYENSRPFLTINYLNNKGLESYWTYHEQNMGESGTGYVNDYTGNLVYIAPLVETTGSVMPVSLSMVYNGYQSGKTIDHVTTVGNGWRLNIQQCIIPISENGTSLEQKLYEAGYRYIYEDADGTAHYFTLKEGSSTIYIDEEGLGLELKKISTDDDLEYYQLTADEGGKLTFTGSGYLRKAYDDNGNFYTIRYGDVVNGCIAYIEDGVGRVIDITMDSENRVSTIEDPAGRTVSVSYTAGGSVSVINYPDGTQTAFAYNDSRLRRVKGRDLKRLQYLYPDSGDTATRSRIVEIQEYANNDGGNYAEENLGTSMTISYKGKNRTRFQDGTGFWETYQFDNYGRTLSITDSAGGAETYKYVKGSDRSKAANRITAAGSTSHHVNNLLRDHSFENSSGDWALTDEGAEITSGTAWLGNRSLKVTDSVGYGVQWYTGTSGTFTLSAYVKTESADVLPKIRATFFDSSGNVIERKESEPISRKATWERTRVTFTVPDNTANFNIICKNEGVGSAWFDGIQLETGRSLNAYNLVENSNFADISSTAWGGYNLNAEDGDGHYTSTNYGRYYRIYGDGGTFKRRGQTIPIQQKASDVHFSVSGVGYCDSVPLRDSRKFGIMIYTTFTDGTDASATISFNPDYAGGWQYASGTVGYSGANASKTIDYIVVRGVYYYNENCAGFDNIKVTLDETGSAYAYDDDGNLISSIDNAKRKETFTYNDNGDLTKAISSDNKSYAYTYSSNYKHRMLSATSKSSNLKFTFGYDSKGNATSQRIYHVTDDGTESDAYIGTYTAYTDDGNYIAYESDDRGYAENYTYHETKGLLTEVEDRRDNITSYTYDSADDNLLSVTSGDSTVNYTYNSKNDLTKITSPSTAYSFSYDTFGNVLTTKAGTNTLNTNTYEENNGNLISSTYGNGFEKSYIYDSYDRVITEAYDGNNKFNWSYNADGQVGRHYDSFLGKTYYYTYDLIGRPIRTDISDGSYIRSSYNDVDLSTDIHYKIAGIGGKDVYYTYSSRDNLPSKVKFGPDGKCHVSNTYDDLTRLTKKTYTSLNEDATNVSAGYGYLNWSNADYPDRTTGLVNSIDFTHATGELTVRDRYYRYDKNRNITEERSGTSSDGSLREKYTYDDLNQLTRHDSAVQNKSYTYTYDDAGNLLEKKTYAYTTGTLGEAEDTVTYQYSTGSWKDLLTSYDGTAITYDAIGNMKTFGDKSFTWQGRNLRTFTEGTDQSSYVYNAEGIRTKKTVNGTTTEYFLNGNQILAEVTDGSAIWYFYDSQGHRTGLMQDGKAYYYLYSIQGDVIGLARATTGKIVATYKYDAWGNCRVVNAEGHTIGDDNPFRYRGYYYDGESGLYYLNSRYYNPEVGRFISADGQINGDILGANLYAYCSNNPVSRADNQGAFWDTILDIGFTAYSIWNVLKDPKDPKNWAALGLDLLCLVIPAATGGGAAARAASKADDVVDTGKAINRVDNIANAGKYGSYVIRYSDDTTYVGKGSRHRADVSAKQHADDERTVISLNWEAAVSERQAFIDEYIKMCQYGGPNNTAIGNIYSHNKIWSPGRKFYYQEHGDYYHDGVRLW